MTIKMTKQAEETNRKPQCRNCKRYIPAASTRCPICGHK